MKTTTFSRLALAAAFCLIGLFEGKAQTVPAGYAVNVYATTSEAPIALTIDPVGQVLYYAGNGQDVHAVPIQPGGGTEVQLGSFIDFNPYIATAIQYYNGEIYMVSGGDVDAVGATGTNASVVAQTPFASDESGEAVISGSLYITSGVTTEVGESPGQLLAMNLTTDSTNAVTLTGSATDSVSTIQYNPVDGYLYAVEYGDAASFVRIDPKSGTVTVLPQPSTGSFDYDAGDQSGPIGSGIGRFAIDPSGQYFFFRADDGVIYQYTLADGTTTPFVTGLDASEFDTAIVFGPSSSGTGYSMYFTYYDGGTIDEVSGFSAPASRVININFDTDASGNPLTAPGFFDETDHLTELYASLGVHFSGPGGDDGGAILNEEGSFGVNAHSGSNFLAFNPFAGDNAEMTDGGLPIGPETISFDSLMSTVSIYAAGGQESCTFLMQAYDANGNLLTSDTVTCQNWAQMQVSSSTGIKSVVLTETAPANPNGYIFDDLSATTLGAPATTPVPTLTAPLASSTVCSPITVSFTLPEPASPGSVQLTFDNGEGSPVVLTLGSAYDTAGSQSITFDPANPGAYVAAISGGTSLPIGVYTVTLSYQDTSGDPVGSTSAANVTLSPVSTPGANYVNSYSANLLGFVRSDYLSSASNGYMETGTNTAYTTGTTGALSYYDWNGYGYLYYAGISNLSRDTTYHYQFISTVNGTNYYGGDQTFTTTHDDAPTANNDTFYLPLNKTAPVVLNVLANDTLGNPFDTLTIISFTRPSGGTLAITGNGTTLTYTPSSRYSGNDSFNYTISDGYGGTSTATVYIRDPYLQFAGNFQSLVSTGTTPGYLTVTLGTGGSFSGSLKTLGGSYSFAGGFNDSGNSTVALSAKNLPSLSLALTLSALNGGSFAYSLTGASSVPETGDFTQKVVFSSANPCPQTGTYTIAINPPTQEYLQPAYATATEAGGVITAVTIVPGNAGAGYVSAPAIAVTGTNPKASSFAAVAHLSNGEITSISVTKGGSKYTGPLTVTISPPSGLPQGYGWATMKVSNSGAVSMTGKLADGVAFTAGSWIDANLEYNYYSYNPYAYATPTFPVFSNIYTAPVGYLEGSMTFEDEVDVSDLDSQGASFTWYKPPQTTAQIYSGGFNTSLGLFGSYYVDPLTDYLLDLQNISPNAQITMSGGTLGGELQNYITLPQAPATAATVVSGSNDSLSLASVPTTGAFSGKVTPPGAKTAAYSGVYLQKQNLGYGFFSGTTESGGVFIVPQ